jgi:hypothetical protein
VTSFSLSVQLTCLVMLILLLIYSLMLLRFGRLNAHITVRWVLAECAAILAVILWGKLPIITFTSKMEDRELLVILAVVIFSLVAFFTLDCLTRISSQHRQIVIITQELALLRERVEANASTSNPSLKEESLIAKGAPADTRSENTNFLRNSLLSIYIILCIGFYLFEMHPSFPALLTHFLSANYRQ